MEKISIFVDVQNVYYTCREAYQDNFDYNKFWAEVTQGRELVTAIAYATDRGDAKQTQFQNILRAIGFTVKLKPYIQRQDGSAKGDWDVGITIDVMAAAAAGLVDTIVLLSGDGDFDLLLEKVKKDYQLTAEVYGVSTLTAKSLIDSATQFHPISDAMLL